MEGMGVKRAIMSAPAPGYSAVQRHETTRRSGSQASAPKVGVIYNPRSHLNQGQDLDSNPAPHVYVAQPGGQDQLPAALERFVARGIELLVINGGDGTVRDVLTAGHQVFGDNWPAIAVLPKGKTNALAVDLEAPQGWTLQNAIDAYAAGDLITRHPLTITRIDGSAPAELGFIMGAGAYTTGIRAGQSAHKLGAFNALAVLATAVYGVLQAMFGSRRNIWRRGAPMTIKLGDQGKNMPHSGHGDVAQRQLLLASTLTRFPAGIKPFGALGEGLKLAVLDQTTRRNLLKLPLVLMGRNGNLNDESGLHQIAAKTFEIDLDDEFVLDGEIYPKGHLQVEEGPQLRFVTGHRIASQ